MSDIGYLELPVETDFDELRDAGIERLGENWPGWEPSDAHLEVGVLAETSRIGQTVNDTAARMAQAAFRFLGELSGVDPIDGAHAEVSTIWTFRDDAGHTIPAGTVVAFDGVDVAWLTIDDVTVDAGGISAVGVTVRAADVGAQHNDYPPQTLTLIDQLAFVDSVSSIAVTDGGVDAETDAAYLDRFAQRQRLRPIRPGFAEDYALLARDVAGVHRAVGLDGYRPDGTNGHTGEMTVYAVDVAGDPLAVPVDADLETYLNDPARRRVNDIVHVAAPAYTPIAVDFTIATSSDFVAGDVLAAAISAVATFLAKGVWGGGTDEPPRWDTGENTVRYSQVIGVLQAVPGVRYVDSLTLNAGVDDVVLDAPVALPDATVTGALA